MYWDGTFLESNPVQVELVLTHDANGDSCEAWLSQVVVFDLKSISAMWAGESEVGIRINGNDAVIWYVP